MAMPDTVHFHLERYDDDGVYYVIEGVELALVTDGRTIEEALRLRREGEGTRVNSPQFPFRTRSLWACASIVMAQQWPPQLR
ncbi:MAG: hypothetical protein ACYDBJ_24025 [Aggregatilineales bacterium]